VTEVDARTAFEVGTSPLSIRIAGKGARALVALGGVLVTLIHLKKKDNMRTRAKREKTNEKANLRVG